MKLFPILAIAVSLAVTGLASLSGGLLDGPRPITGDYLEARTASVMAGACHYNGELVTTGRDALLAWNFTGGTFAGVDLSGLRAVAEVTSDDNLGIAGAARRTELAVDASATNAQVGALAALLQARCGDQLGPIVHIRRTTVTFAHGAAGYTVNAAGFAALIVQYRADNSCCVQPNLVWYAPLAPIAHRMVGFTDTAAYSGGVGVPWQRSGEDSAMYGDIAF